VIKMPLISWPADVGSAWRLVKVIVSVLFVDSVIVALALSGDPSTVVPVGVAQVVIVLARAPGASERLVPSSAIAPNDVAAPRHQFMGNPSRTDGR
jgi:hypothetical protein